MPLAAKLGLATLVIAGFLVVALHVLAVHRRLKAFFLYIHYGPPGVGAAAGAGAACAGCGVPFIS